MCKMKDSGVPWIGEIPEGWEVKKLKYISKLKTGTTPSGNKGINSFEGYNWFTPSDFITQSLNMSSKFIHEDIVKDENIHLYPAGSTLLVGIGATVGKTAITQNASYSNQQITAVMPMNTNAKYLFYSMYSCADYIKDNALYTTLQIISNGYLKDIQFLNPSLQTQQRIADFLDAKCTHIDDTITKEKELIEKLKEYRQSVITEAVTTGLNPSALMKDSGVKWIGEIPQSWKVNKLSRLILFINGYAFVGSELSSDKETPVIRIGDIQGHVVDYETCLCFNNHDFLEDYQVKHNDIVIAMSGATTGKIAYVSEPPKAYVNQRVGIIRCLRVPKFVFYLLQVEPFLEYIFLLSAGSAQPNISSNSIQNFYIPIPSTQEQQDIADYLNKQTALIDHAIRQKENLIAQFHQYKKSLIYEAITGKMEV